MSMGLGCWSKKCYEDAQIIRYAYGAYDWSDRMMWNEQKEYDGEIYIDKAAFLQAEDCALLLQSGEIRIRNSRFASYITGEYDRTALHLLYKLLRYVKENGEFPEQLAIAT